MSFASLGHMGVYDDEGVVVPLVWVRWVGKVVDLEKGKEDG